MQFKWSTTRWVILLILNIQLVICSSCSKGIEYSGAIIYTKIPSAQVSAEQIVAMDYRYASGMQIALCTKGESTHEDEEVSKGLNSARSPEVSYDGTQIVFSAKKAAGDTWQIWTMDLSDQKPVQITESNTNCTDPTWLPDGRIAYSKIVEDKPGLKYHALFTIGADGCCEQRITFHPHDDLSPSVMHDGRILFASTQIFPDRGSVKYLAMRPDGTKAELFFQPDSSITTTGKAFHSIDKVLFASAGQAASIRFGRPLHSYKKVYDSEMVSSLFPVSAAELIVSEKLPTNTEYGLKTVGRVSSEVHPFNLNMSGFHIVEPVGVNLRPVAKKLPTRVNPDKETGHMFCMNAGESEIDVEKQQTAVVQVIGMKGVLGETEVEEDGSFYFELQADQPVRFQTLDENKEAVRGPSAWMWVRPNERRGCVGCHEDREIVPENEVPMAINKPPLAIK